MHGYALTQPHAFSLFHPFLGNEWTVLPIMGFALLIVVGLVIWYVVRQSSTATTHGQHYMAPTPTSVAAPTPQASSDPAEAIVRDRFARGEIDAEEYARIVATLRTR